MKKFAKIAVVTLSAVALICTLSGCMSYIMGKEIARSAKDSIAQDEGGSHKSTVTAEPNIPGTFTVPDGWVLSQEHSTDSKAFYTEANQENAARPNNVSVRVDKNRYSEEDHIAFREAIMRQLVSQTHGESEISGSGETSSTGNILYAFEIDEGETVTVFYYIVGDMRYCEFQATDFDGSTAANNAAYAMADSFVWD